MDRTVAHLRLRPVDLRLIRKAHVARGRHAGFAMRHDRFKPFHRRLIGRAADIAGSVVVIIGKDAGDLAVVLHAISPVGLEVAQLFILPIEFQPGDFIAQRSEFLHIGWLQLFAFGFLFSELVAELPHLVLRSAQRGIRRQMLESVRSGRYRCHRNMHPD